ncbi:MAG: YbbR-like domain-containing protein [Pyrinomonadaceae bacterium]|nr:YbbR-like domain-containing protein [Pyrinomonadaceae bacterium]
MPYRDTEDELGRAARVQRGAQGWLRAIFLDDWSLKLLALAITLGLWFGVTGQRTPATIRLSNVQLNFRLPNAVEISNEPPDKVDVILTGSKESLDRLNSRNLIAFVDASGYQQGMHTIRLMRDTVTMDLPEGVRMDAVDPNSVALRLEPREEREVPVEVEFIGKLPDGYELRRATPTPTQVKVRGPASRVKTVSRAVTEKISLDGLTSSTNIAQAALSLSDDHVTVSDPVVSVFLEIGEQRIEKSFSGIAVSESNGAAVRPQTATVTLYGERSVIEKLRAEDLSIILSVADDGSIAQRLVLPQGAEGRVELRNTKPSGFTIIK